MARLIDMYISDSLEVVEKLKNKLNLLKSPMDILNQQEIEELKELNEKDNDYFIKLEKYFDITNPTNDIIEVKHEYLVLKENIKTREKLIKFYEDKYLHSKLKKTTTNTDRPSLAYETESSSHSSIENMIENDLPDIQTHFLNTIITTNHISELKSKSNLIEERKYLCEIFLLKENNGKDQILIDFYMNLFNFCVKKNFTLEKSSTFCSIMYFIFNYSILGRKIMKQKCFALFIKLMEYHTLSRPPYSYLVFDNSDKIDIITFINDTFFRNYSLFENIFKYNVNIYLTSKPPKIIPSDNLPPIHTLTFEFMIDSLEKDLVEKIHKTINKHPDRHNSKEIIQPKSEYEVYSETINEKLNSFRNTFNKTNKFTENIDNDKYLDKEAYKMKEKEELSEANDILEIKLKEIDNETQERIQIENRVVERKLEKRLAEININKKK